MADEETQTPPGEQTVETQTTEETQEPKLLMGKYKTAEEMAEAFQGYQSTTTKERERSKRIYDQLTSAGYTIDDDPEATVRVPSRATPKETKPDEEAEPDLYDPEVAAKTIKDLRGQVGSLQAGFDVVTTAVTGTTKAEFLKEFSAGARADAGASWDAKMRQLPAAARVDGGTQEAVKGMIFREIHLKHGGRGLAASGNEGVSRGAGAAERPGGETTERTAPATITVDMRRTYDGLGGKAELGKTLEEFAASVEETTGGTE